MDIINHSGVKGMKWGIRKRKASSGKKRFGFKLGSKSSSVPEHWRKRYKNISSMSDKDLKRYTERLRLENSFAEQVKRRATTVQKPKKNWISKAANLTGDSKKIINNAAVIAGAISATAGATHLAYRHKKDALKIADVAFKAARKRI